MSTSPWTALGEAWAGQKEEASRKEPPAESGGSNRTVNFHKEKRSNQTHQSLTDPLARLSKKSRAAEAKLGYLGHVVTENRHGLVVDAQLTLASGTAGRDAAAAMLGAGTGRKASDAGRRPRLRHGGFVGKLRGPQVNPHVAQNTSN
jgi:hypothetical protein